MKLYVNIETPYKLRNAIKNYIRCKIKNPYAFHLVMIPGNGIVKTKHIRYFTIDIRDERIVYEYTDPMLKASKRKKTYDNKGIRFEYLNDTLLTELKDAYQKFYWTGPKKTNYNYIEDVRELFTIALSDINEVWRAGKMQLGNVYSPKMLEYLVTKWKLYADTIKHEFMQFNLKTRTFYSRMVTHKGELIQHTDEIWKINDHWKRVITLMGEMEIQEYQRLINFDIKNNN